MKESSKISMNVVGVNKEAQIKLKKISKDNKKTMGTMISEIILNYGGSNLKIDSQITRDVEEKVLVYAERIEAHFVDVERLIKDVTKPWYKRLFS